MIASPENSSAKAEAALRKESLENFMIREKFLKKNRVYLIPAQRCCKFVAAV